MYEVRREVHTANKNTTTLNEVDNLKQLYSSSLWSKLRVLATLYVNAVVHGKYRSSALVVYYETGLRTKEWYIYSCRNNKLLINKFCYINVINCSEKAIKIISIISGRFLKGFKVKIHDFVSSFKKISILHLE